MTTLEELREELGPIVDLCDTVICIEKVDYKSLLVKFTEKLWDFTESEVQAGNLEDELRIILQGLTICLGKKIKLSVNEKDYNIIVKNINDFLREELNI